MNDLTIIYLTANKISFHFLNNTFRPLLVAIGKDTPLITVSKKELFVGEFDNHNYKNIVFDTPSTHINIYREALAGVKEADTKYIAIAEDDVLYHAEHFKYRPKSRAFAYNSNSWSIYTWVKPALFSYKGQRRNHCYLICERDLYIETMEERFKKYEGIPDEQIPLHTFAEPGRYEGNLGLTIRETELFSSNPPNIMFTHPTGLSWGNLGTRKRLGDVRALEIPYWGKAENILKMYE